MNRPDQTSRPASNDVTGVNVSSNLGASFDLRAMDLIINADIYIDKCKIDRAKAKVKANAHQKHDEKVENLCIGVDGKTDKDTLIYKEVTEENGEKSLKESKGPEHHLTFTKEMAYLTHTGATGAVLAKFPNDSVFLKRFR